MKSYPIIYKQFNILTALLICSIASSEVCAQNKPPAEPASPTAPAAPISAPLNLDDRRIARELGKEEPGPVPTEKISVSPNRMDESFNKAERHGNIPTIKEINVSGAPERVTKVTGADGESYCVYSPTVARTDGIDAIQNGVQNQVRSCPQ